MHPRWNGETKQQEPYHPICNVPFSMPGSRPTAWVQAPTLRVVVFPGHHDTGLPQGGYKLLWGKPVPTGVVVARFTLRGAVAGAKRQPRCLESPTKNTWLASKPCHPIYNFPFSGFQPTGAGVAAAWEGRRAEMYLLPVPGSCFSLSFFPVFVSPRFPVPVFPVVVFPGSRFSPWLTIPGQSL